MATKEKNEYLKNGVLYRNDLRVGDDGMNRQERGNKKVRSPDAPVGVDGLTAAQRGRAVQKANKEKRAYPIQLLKKEFKLEVSLNAFIKKVQNTNTNFTKSVLQKLFV